MLTILAFSYQTLRCVYAPFEGDNSKPVYVVMGCTVGWITTMYKVHHSCTLQCRYSTTFLSRAAGSTLISFKLFLKKDPATLHNYAFILEGAGYTEWGNMIKGLCAEVH